MPNTRGRAACNTCRARKQKCDGIRPECSRCRQIDHQCTWPKSLKRGPAKGYTKALECRLRETELALLQLLMSSKDETISKAFHPESQSMARVYHEQLYDQLAEHDLTGGSEEKQRALRDQWEQFPLQTASDIRHWTERLKQSGEYQPENDTQEPPEVQHNFGNFFNNTHQSTATFQSPSSVVEDQPFESQHQMDPMVQAPNPQSPIESIPSADDIPTSTEVERDLEVSNSISCEMELPTNFKESFLW